LMTACPTVKSSVVNPTDGNSPVKSTHACFPHTHPQTRTSMASI
jgi:hypothetical protein